MSQADDFGYLPHGTWPASDGHYPRVAGRPQSPGPQSPGPESPCPWPPGPWPPEPSPPGWRQDAGRPRYRVRHREPREPRYPRPADRNVRGYPPGTRRASPLEDCALLAGPPPARPGIPGYPPRPGYLSRLVFAIRSLLG